MHYIQSICCSRMMFCPCPKQGHTLTDRGQEQHRHQENSHPYIFLVTRTFAPQFEFTLSLIPFTDLEICDPCLDIGSHLLESIRPTSSDPSPSSRSFVSWSEAL